MTTPVTLKVTTTSVGASSAAIATANTNRRFLMIANCHATQYIEVNLAGGTAVVGDGSSFRIAALSNIKFEGEVVPSNAINAIASGSGTLVAVYEG